MRIGFIGAGATGKTTVGKVVSEKSGLPFVPSVSREVFKSRGLVEADQLNMTGFEKLDLQMAIFEAYRDRLKTFEADQVGTKVCGMIADRTLLDHYCYMLYRCNEVMTKGIIDGVSKEVQANLAAFDLLVYCPVGFLDLMNDGFREVNRAYNTLLDAMMVGFLEKWDCRYLTLPCGTPAERASHVLRVMNCIQEHGGFE